MKYLLVLICCLLLVPVKSEAFFYRRTNVNVNIGNNAAFQAQIRQPILFNRRPNININVQAPSPVIRQQLIARQPVIYSRQQLITHAPQNLIAQQRTVYNQPFIAQQRTVYNQPFIARERVIYTQPSQLIVTQPNYIQREVVTQPQQAIIQQEEIAQPSVQYENIPAPQPVQGCGCAVTGQLRFSRIGY